MSPSHALSDFAPLLARHQRSMLHHLCKEIERSGHPEDVRTAHWVAQLDGQLALQVFRSLYSPHLRKVALDALLQIREAQRRLDRGVYDICNDCGTTLAPRWLRRHPVALRCPTCLAHGRNDAL